MHDTKTKVLVIEDEASIRRFITLNLEMAGFEIGEAASGEDALTLLSAYLMLFFPAMPWRRKRPVGRSGCSRGRNGATVMPRSAFGLVGAVRRLRVRAETRLAQDPGSTVAGRRPADLRDGAFGLGARGAICDRRDRRAGHARAPSNQTSLRRRAASQLASAITPAVARQSGSPPS